MTARVIDGAAIAAGLREKVAAAARRLRENHGIVPGLAVVLTGDNPASAVYVRNKAAQTEAAGMRSFIHRLPATAGAADLLDRIAALNADPAVHGMLVQLPLPPQIREGAVIHAVGPRKDVDCFHPENVGLLAAGHPRFAPCTPAGVVALCAAANADTRVEAVAAIVAPATLVTEEQYADGMRMALLVPRLFAIGDVPHIAALGAPRRLLIAGGVTPQGKPLAGKELEAAYAFAREVYDLHKAGDRLTVVEEAKAEDVARMIVG